MLTKVLQGLVCKLSLLTNCCDKKLLWHRVSYFKNRVIKKQPAEIF